MSLPSAAIAVPSGRGHGRGWRPGRVVEGLGGTVELKGRRVRGAREGSCPVGCRPRGGTGPVPTVPTRPGSLAGRHEGYTAVTRTPPAQTSPAARPAHA